MCEQKLHTKNKKRSNREKCLEHKGQVKRPISLKYQEKRINYLVFQTTNGQSSMGKYL